MQKADFLTKNKKGFSTVEVLLSVAIFSLLIVGLSGGLFYALQSSAVVSARTKGLYLAEEGLEATRNIAEQNFTALADGTYGIDSSSNKWAFSGTSDTTDGYVRKIQVTTIDSTTKQIISTISFPRGSSNDISLTMYLTNWYRNVPLGNWTAVSLNGSLDLIGTEDGIKVQTLGNYAYVIRNGGTTDFTIINISNSSSPTVAGSLNLPDSATNIFVSGNYAYISSSSNSSEFQIVNISNPSSPVLVGQLDLAGNADARGVHVTGDYAYIVKDQAGGTSREFNIINISNPSLPVLSGSLDISNGVMDVTVIGNYAYTASTSNSEEMQIINITSPTNPTLAGNFNITGNFISTSIASNGTTILLGANNNLYAFSLTNPTAPTLRGSFDTGGLINDITLNPANTIAFLGTTNPVAEFNAVNIVTPSSMASLITFDAINSINGIAYDSAKNKIYSVTPTDTREFIILGTQ